MDELCQRQCNAIRPRPKMGGLQDAMNIEGFHGDGCIFGDVDFSLNYGTTWTVDTVDELSHCFDKTTTFEVANFHAFKAVKVVQQA